MLILLFGLLTCRYLSVTMPFMYSILWLRYLTVSLSCFHLLINDCSSSRENTWSSSASAFPVSMYFSNSSSMSLTRMYRLELPSARIDGSAELFLFRVFQKSFSDGKMALTVPFCLVFFVAQKQYDTDRWNCHFFFSFFCFFHFPGFFNRLFSIPRHRRNCGKQMNASAACGFGEIAAGNAVRTIDGKYRRGRSCRRAKRRDYRASESLPAAADVTAAESSRHIARAFGSSAVAPVASAAPAALCCRSCAEKTELRPTDPPSDRDEKSSHRKTAIPLCASRCVLIEKAASRRHAICLHILLVSLK